MGPRDVFVDTSRQRNRRWCPADDCGNRNRVRAHYQRGRDRAQRAD
ncbi:CGNR zinc finger domain-containing protein [Nostocoides australiense]|nr:CGNR zinc finger domain-containing protein [Tetrasphaera australiensis]